MSVFKCKMCGGTLEVHENQTTATCMYCGTQQTLPKLDSERRAQMYDRANHFRRNNEFDKAMGIYEKILDEDHTDAEAYWSLVLCRYGIEYVEDPVSHKRIPTVNRAQYTSIFDDEDYKSALQHADGYQRSIYEEEARTINEIQKGILAISQKEEPFDVFICYKETDANGQRTPDSVLANDLYHELTQEGFKVFFSRITLEDKLGTAYEPYIFAALHSAKVMVVIGTKPEYFNAPWVKNEWSRYLALIQNGEQKVLIPAYRDMDPYDLPEEFAHLQAQDMSKLGFMQDLIRGIEKLTGATEEKEDINGAGNGHSVNVEALLKRVFLFLEDGDFAHADDFCEQVLNQDPENARAYLGKLMAELKVRKFEDLQNVAEPFVENTHYQKVIRFGDEALKAKITACAERVRNERTYAAALSIMKQAKSPQELKKAADGFGCISTYKDAEALKNQCLETIYAQACDTMSRAALESTLKELSNVFGLIWEYKDSAELQKACLEKAEDCRKDAIYRFAVSQMKKAEIPEYEEAIKNFETIQEWKDAKEQIRVCQEKIRELRDIQAEEEEKVRQAAKRKTQRVFLGVAGGVVAVCLIIIVAFWVKNVYLPDSRYKEGLSLMQAGDNSGAIQVFTELGDYKDVAEYLPSLYYAQGQKALEEKNYRQAVFSFAAAQGYEDSASLVRELNVQSICAGAQHSVALKDDGTVVTAGENEYGENDVDNWKNIVAVSAGRDHTVGLKADGTVVAVGDNTWDECNVSDWTDIIAISAGGQHTVGLKSDGTVVATGSDLYGQCGVHDWKNVVAISANEDQTFGLLADGRVVMAGHDDSGQGNVSKWIDIVAISAGESHTVGLKADGTVVAVGDNRRNQCDVSDWTDIVAVSAGDTYTVGLKSNGTVVITSNSGISPKEFEDWNNIVAVSTSGYCVIGLKSDGTVMESGSEIRNRDEISNWKNIRVPKK